MAEKIKVLFVDHEAVLGGAEQSMVNLVAALSNKNVQVAVAIAGEGELAGALKRAGVSEIYYMPMDGWRCWETGIINRLKLFLSLPLFLRNIVKWKRLIREVKPDIVHFNLTRLVDPVIAAKLTGVKTIMHFRELTMQNRNFSGGIFALYKLMRLADIWIANSAATAKDIIPYARGKKVLTVNNGVDVDRFRGSADVEFEFIPKDKFIIAKIAGLGPWKNHKAFLEIASIICSKRKDVVFLIVGRGADDYTEELQQLCRQLGIADNVVFTGFVDNIPALLQKTDILVHTSVKESFGRVYIEAMAAGKPVVAFEAAATNHIIENGVSGYVVKPGESMEMANRIEYLLDNQNIRKEFGSRGRAIANEQFSISITADKVYSIYQMIV